MYTIDLVYVGRGLHEELAAYIADQDSTPTRASTSRCVTAAPGTLSACAAAPPSGSAGHCCPG
ncbi:hypothetical protein ACFY20_40620 [Streptomyces sp. NPDC001312]|uniref:hypothetical protein n=1 Tax=Streptomyces sp. NPDC001312 TaxID=3364561 RepID=UPI0036A15F5F